jgi:hypothetical protein
VARTGVLQGEAANANVRPARYACTPANYLQRKILLATKVKSDDMHISILNKK